MPFSACDLPIRSEEHTSELQSLRHIVCRLLLEKNMSEVSTIRSAQAARPGGALQPVSDLVERVDRADEALPLPADVAPFFLMTGPPPRSPLFPPTTLVR